MTNIIPFKENAKCPPGTYALHKTHGVVEIISSEGQYRTIMCGDASFGDLECHQVDVKTLRELDYERDSRPISKAKVIQLQK